MCINAVAHIRFTICQPTKKNLNKKFLFDTNYTCWIWDNFTSSYRVARIKELKKETMKQFWSNVLIVWRYFCVWIHAFTCKLRIFLHFLPLPFLLFDLISSFIFKIPPLPFHSSRHMDTTATHSFYTNHIQIFVGKLMLKVNFIYRIHSHFGIIMFSKTYGRPGSQRKWTLEYKPWSLRRFIRSISHPFAKNAVSHVLCVGYAAVDYAFVHNIYSFLLHICCLQTYINFHVARPR